MRLGRVLIWAFLLLAVFGGLFAAFWNLPILEVSKIEVVGADEVSQTDISAASGVTVGMNAFREFRLNRSLLRLGMPDREESVRSMAWIRDADVRFILPGTVRITVRERTAAAWIDWVGNCLVLDENGVVLEALPTVEGKGWKEVRGIEFDQYTLGAPLSADDPALLDTALLVLRAVRESDRDSENCLWDRMDWVDVLRQNRVVFSLDNRVAVRMDPTTDLQYRIDYTKEIYFNHIGEGQAGTLDFTKGGSPTFVPDP